MYVTSIISTFYDEKRKPKSVVFKFSDKTLSKCTRITALYAVRLHVTSIIFNISGSILYTCRTSSAPYADSSLDIMRSSSGNQDTS